MTVRNLDSTCRRIYEDAFANAQNLSDEQLAEVFKLANDAVKATCRAWLSEIKSDPSPTQH